MKKFFILQITLISLILFFACQRGTSSLNSDDYCYPDCLKGKEVFEERLAGQQLDDITDYLSEYEGGSYEFIFDDSYKRFSPDEPDYSKYVKKGETEIFVNVWDVNGYIVKTWSMYNKKREKIVFSSLEYKKDSVIF